MSATPKTPGDPPIAETVAEQPHLRVAHPVPESIGPYRVIEIIGEGGMGVVYKAEQREPVRRVVALKIIKLGMDTKEVLARFDAERQALALMSHPNVAKVFEAGFTGSGGPYFAMEYVPGVSITAYCDTQKLTTRERLELFIPVCQAIQHAHQKGIIHRDLKPGNILITLFDGKPVPKVIDFGVAKATSIQLTQKTLFTQSGTVIGTLEYMSPEQATSSGLDVDTRTDVYSLGVILYQLLTGSLPFEPETLRKVSMEMVAHIIQNTDPPKPSQRLTGSRLSNNKQSKLPDTAEIARRHRTDVNTLRRELQGDLDWIVLKAMEKDRTRRYESASAFAADIQRHLSDEPVEARPPSTLYRVEKFVTRHRFGVFAAVAIFAALNAGLAAATYGLVKAKKATANAVSALQRANEQTAIAQQKEKEAKESTARAEQFSSFSQDLLSSIASQTTRKFDVQILDDVAHDIDRTASVGDPLDECRLRIQLARRYVALGFHRRAIAQFASALNSNYRAKTKGTELLSNLNEFADALMVDGKIAEAEKLVREALATLPSGDQTDAATAFTLDLLGSIEAASDRWQDAELHLNRAAAIRGNMKANRSATERRSGDTLAHQGALLLHKNDPEGRNLIEQAFQEYTRNYSGANRGIVGPMRRMARDAMRQLDWASARRFLDQAQPKRNADPGFLQDLIEVQNGLLQSRPDDPELLVDRAIYFARLGQFKEAAKDYARILQLRPDDADATFRYLTLLQAIDIDRYRVERHKALQRFGHLNDAELMLQIAKSSLASPIEGDDLQTACELARRAAALNPMEPFHIQGMGMAELRDRSFVGAINFFAKSHDASNFYRNALNDFYAAMAWMLLDDRVRAQAAFRAASRAWDVSAPVPGVDDLRQFREYLLCTLAREEARGLIAPGDERPFFK
ncbi:MAG TPA: tetratricopeptide repeat protein [Tepidisphaeraceae bacterium]|jgi:serine/threonine protein kinase/Flp pilus assembly protein TadD